MKSRYKDLEQLARAREEKHAAIRRRLEEFGSIPPEKYFYELVYCFLTPQSSAVNAMKAQQLLTQRNFENEEVDPEPLLHQKEFYIRFHKTKARLLREMKVQYGEILATLTAQIPAEQKREWLVKHVKGIGYKEATHFLRNIGQNGGLAILDRHILRNLKKHGAIKSLPRTLTPKKYLSIETRFQKFAEDVGIPLDELDLIFWSNEAGEILK